MTGPPERGPELLSFDGEKLGKVFALEEDAFYIEKGLFFPKDYLVRYSEISDIRNGEIILMHGRESLLRLSGEDRYGTSTSQGTSATTGVGSTGRRAEASASTERPLEGRRSDEVAIPVHKEELDVTKREVQAGEVRIHKEIVEEEETVSVPVRKERVRVERRDVKDRPAASASFQDETVAVPLRAEEVDIHKRPVVEEEVVIRKDATEEERQVTEPVRHEKVDIRTSGEEDKRSMNLNPDEDPTLRRS